MRPMWGLSKNRHGNALICIAVLRYAITRDGGFTYPTDGWDFALIKLSESERLPGPVSVLASADAVVACKSSMIARANAGYRNA